MPKKSTAVAELGEISVMTEDTSMRDATSDTLERKLPLSPEESRASRHSLPMPLAEMALALKCREIG